MTDPAADPIPAADPGAKTMMVNLSGDGIETSPCGIEHLKSKGYFVRGSPEHREAQAEQRRNR